RARRARRPCRDESPRQSKKVDTSRRAPYVVRAPAGHLKLDRPTEGAGMRGRVRAADAARAYDAVGARRVAADRSTAAFERGEDSPLIAALRAVGAVTPSARPNAESVGDVDADGTLDDNPFAFARAQQAQPRAQDQQLGVAPSEFLLAIGLGLARGP